MLKTVKALFLSGKWKRWAIALGVWLIVVSVGKDLLVKCVVTTAGSHLLGVRVAAEGCSLSLLTWKVTMRGVTIAQPDGFEDGTLLDIADISVHCNPLAFLRGEWHIPEASITVNAFVLAKDKEKRLVQASASTRLKGSISASS